MRDITDLGRRPVTMREAVRNLDRATDIIAAAVPIARALVNAKKQEKVMSVLDKLKLVAERRVEHDKRLSEGADKLLERYATIGEKTEDAFDKHHKRLDAEMASLDETEEVIDRLSNMGNSSGSDESSEPQKNGTSD